MQVKAERCWGDTVVVNMMSGNFHRAAAECRRVAARRKRAAIALTFPDNASGFSQTVSAAVRHVCNLASAPPLPRRFSGADLYEAFVARGA